MADIFDVRNALHTGAYQQCINEAERSSTDDDECKVLMYRAMVALGKYAIVKSEIGSDASSDLQAVKRLATYHKGSKAGVVAEVKKLQEDGISMSNPTVALLSGTVFFLEGAHDEALRCLKHSGAESSETVALAAQVLVAMHRPDMAKKELKKMEEIDEDSTLCKLTKSWIGLAIGGEGELSHEEAFYNFKELSEKYGDTPLLLNGQAAALLQSGKFEEAEQALEEAQTKDPNNAETMINMIALYAHVGKSPDRLFAQLKDEHPNHPYTVAFVAKEDEFDELSAAAGSSA